MSFLELVEQRRSCRQYSDQAVTFDKIQRCLEAARLAPSACNSQPWRFIVVADYKLKNEFAQKVFGGIYGMNRFAVEAPVLVVVIREKAKYAAALGAVCRGTQFSLIDLGIACEHFILQAQEEGLGTCWIGWFDEKAAKKVLSLPRHVKMDIVISLGYPKEPLGIKKNRKPLQEMSEIR